jgi:hypothetical protein
MFISSKRYIEDILEVRTRFYELQMIIILFVVVSTSNPGTSLIESVIIIMARRLGMTALPLQRKILTKLLTLLGPAQLLKVDFEL